MTTARPVLVPADRLPRWLDNFAARHGDVAGETRAGRLHLSAADGAAAVAALPLDQLYAGPPDVASFAAAARPTMRWGLLLVRKGGFAVAAVEGSRVVASKVGRRHVQGRTKAGGQSQQRFARRRDNQARQAYAAAAGHTFDLLGSGFDPEIVVCGGDRTAVDAVLSDARLARLGTVRGGPWLPVPDPRRAVLDQAVADACACTITVLPAATD